MSLLSSLQDGSPRQAGLREAHPPRTPPAILRSATEGREGGQYWSREPMNGWCQPHLSLRFALPPSMAGSHCGSSHCCLSRWVDHIHVDAPGPAPLRVQCCRAEESNGHLLRSGPHAVDKNPDLTSSAEGPQRFRHHSLSQLPATSPR